MKNEKTILQIMPAAAGTYAVYADPDNTTKFITEELQMWALVHHSLGNANLTEGLAICPSLGVDFVEGGDNFLGYITNHIPIETYRGALEEYWSNRALRLVEN